MDLHLYSFHDAVELKLDDFNKYGNLLKITIADFDK